MRLERHAGAQQKVVKTVRSVHVQYRHRTYVCEPGLGLDGDAMRCSTGVKVVTEGREGCKVAYSSPSREVQGRMVPFFLSTSGRRKCSRGYVQHGGRSGLRHKKLAVAANANAHAHAVGRKKRSRDVDCAPQSKMYPRYLTSSLRPIHLIHPCTSGVTAPKI